MDTWRTAEHTANSGAIINPNSAPQSLSRDRMSKASRFTHLSVGLLSAHELDVITLTLTLDDV
jgi:hypothetical protein